MSELLEKVRQEISKLFEGKTEHFERTLYYVLVLKPKASEALQVAALIHDIGRLDWRDYVRRGIEIVHNGNSEFYEEHQKISEQKARGLLARLGAGSGLIELVAQLVRTHEKGGTPDADILRDADSISYIEVNAPRHVKESLFGGSEGQREKLDFMFNRITSKKAKELARPMYEKVIKELASV